MQKTIDLHHPLSSLPRRLGGEVRYTLRRSKRARGIRLSVARGGTFTVSAPEWITESRVEAFIREKAEWVLKKIAYFSWFPKIAPVKRINRKKHFAGYKEKARALVLGRLEHFNRHYNLTWNRVAIRNQHSRWGSCSRKKNLNFNYRIALLPPHLSDYIIVHELCHLRELNHSPRFWSLVAETLPNHRTLRTELRTQGVSLS